MTFAPSTRLRFARRTPPVCRFCGKQAGRTAARMDDSICYWACRCGVTSPAPFPDEQSVRAVYDRGYMELRIPGHGLHVRFKPGYRDVFRRERDLTLADLGVRPALLRGLRVLDVGCANGIFLDYLRGYAVDAVGIDISAEMVQAACARGLDARVATLDDMSGQWDVIALWDVLEHLPDPSQALQRVSELLRPGGELLLQTPCTGLISGLFGSRWRNYIYPQHLHLFSQRGLRDGLRRFGFETLRHVRFGSGNTAGTIPSPLKRMADRTAKWSGIGDTLALRARRSGNPVD